MIIVIAVVTTFMMMSVMMVTRMMIMDFDQSDVYVAAADAARFPAVNLFVFYCI